MWSKIFRFVVFVVPLLTIPIACEDMEGFFVDCDECFPDKPDYALVDIRFTINGENPSVVYWLYEGDIDKGELIAVDTAYSSTVQWDLQVDVSYSIVAEYISKGRVINVVDATDLRTKHDRSSCQAECYVVLGDKLDARLRF